MKRRRFLGVAGLGAGLLASSGLPTLLRRAFADTSVNGSRGSLSPSLVEAQTRARQSGKPLLIFVVPDQAADRHERGMAFGELLNHGTPEQLAPLALVEVACASLAELNVEPAPQHLMVLLEEGETPRGLDGKLPSYDWEHMGRGGRGASASDEDRVANQRIAALAALLRPLATDGARLDRWAAVARARSGDADVFTLGSNEAVDRHAAILTRQARRSDKATETLIVAALAKAVIARLRLLPPTGSRWGHASGCGTTYEPTPDDIRRMREEDERARAAGLPPPTRDSYGVKCGMGHVPAKSMRFLDFLASKK